jgi:hypothetical protein
MLKIYKLRKLTTEIIHLNTFKVKNDGFEWVLIPVHGAAQDSMKHEFLSELVRMCESEPLPILLGGDFNILRTREEKINLIFTNWRHRRRLHVNPRKRCVLKREI